ncbi:hypothetical protein [Streptomyces milbemycinicus]|uniref:Uncharacterized protein n=1 Tax=Streptomyces milbemycinicus TaxID=476552 RepID=A0ABW8M227_9ACTN
MGTQIQLFAISGPFFALVMVLLAVAMTHPEPQIRARAERLLAVIFRSR